MKRNRRSMYGVIENNGKGKKGYKGHYIWRKCIGI